jgi:hypothetical protein
MPSGLRRVLDLTRPRFRHGHPSAPDPGKEGPVAGGRERSSKTAWGTPSARSVTASVHASAALSRSEKNGVSRHALRVQSRCSLSPAARASLLCTSRQDAQPLSCFVGRERVVLGYFLSKTKVGDGSDFNPLLLIVTTL